jgi:pilus assembly protein CpaF
MNPNLSKAGPARPAADVPSLVGADPRRDLRLGPLEPLLKDPEISDILVNTTKQVYIERTASCDDRRPLQGRPHLLQVIDRIVSAVGRRIDDSSPMVDARLPDGSRVNAIIPPLALDGPHLSIRKFKRTRSPARTCSATRASPSRCSSCSRASSRRGSTC